jgi:uncharacterized protein YqiB (DUF1249 family)
MIYEKNYKRLMQILPDLATMKTGDAVVLKAESFQDLHVDVLLSPSEGRTLVALAHYYELNGDLISDPDMQIAVYHDRKMVEALTWQNAMGFSEVYPEPGKVNVTMKRELNDFLQIWLKNIISQGHKVEKVS